MSKRGPIVLVDDDTDDLDMFRKIIEESGFTNKIVCFQNSDDAFLYLVDNLNVHPFVIISDINMPRINGIQLKKKIDDSHILRRKSIPFVFHTTTNNQRQIEEAYSYSVQGFFVKGDSVDEVRKSIKVILEYWGLSRTPKDGR